MDILPNIRLLVSPCRSGSTMLLHALAQSDDVYGLYQPIKSDMRYEPDMDCLRIFYGNHPQALSEHVAAKEAVLTKETIGYGIVEECTFPVFQNDEQILISRPLFLFRPPADTWHSWQSFFLVSSSDESTCFDLFCQSFKHVYEMWNHAQKLSSGTAMTMTDLRTDPEKSLKQICCLWGVTYKDEMLNWQYPLFAQFEPLLSTAGKR